MLQNMIFAFFKKIVGDIFCGIGKSVYLCTQKTSRDGAVVARWAHNPKVAGSSPAPATNSRLLYQQPFFIFGDSYVLKNNRRNIVFHK